MWHLLKVLMDQHKAFFRLFEKSFVVKHNLFYEIIFMSFFVLFFAFQFNAFWFCSIEVQNSEQGDMIRYAKLMGSLVQILSPN